MLWNFDKSKGLLAGALFTSMLQPAVATEIAEQVSNQCGSCHQLQPPTPAAQTLEARMQRQAPPLHYAGHKYQQAWLENWLQEPQPINPSGGGYWAHTTVVTDEGDEIVQEKLHPHLSLSAEQAKSISQYLTTLTPYPQLIGDSSYEKKAVSLLFAQKDFRKFKGCAACHRDEADFGGVTGPELYSAMTRLQSTYVESYIRNPKAWDPHTMMPQKQLNDSSIHKLMNYLNTIAEDAP